MSFGYDVSVMILLNKIITLTSYLKLTIKTNKPHYIYLLYKAEKLSVCLSDRHADISAVSASIETGLTRNES